MFFIKGTLKSYFPNAVSYNRFVELESIIYLPEVNFLCSLLIEKFHF